MATIMPPGFRSATEYRFDEEQSDIIARTTSYHWEDYRLSVISFSPHEHLDIRLSIATPFQRTSNEGLGSLDPLPLELLHSTLLHLDIHSLFKFRQTSLGSRQAVDSLKQYQMIVSHGLDLLCALLRTRLATNISLLDFYSALCTKACTVCAGFSGFISLLTWKRCCFKCLKDAPEFQVRSLASARKEFHITKAERGQLRSFKTLPGKYSMEKSEYKSRIEIVSAHQASLICNRRQPHALTQVQPASSRRNQNYNFMGSCALPYYNQRTGKVEHGISCAGCQLGLEKDIHRSRVEPLVYEARNKEYTQDGFLTHFQWCEQAQLLWESSDEGNKKPPELPELARKRSYFYQRK